VAKNQKWANDSMRSQRAGAKKELRHRPGKIRTREANGTGTRMYFDAVANGLNDWLEEKHTPRRGEKGRGTNGLSIKNAAVTEHAAQSSREGK